MYIYWNVFVAIFLSFDECALKPFKTDTAHMHARVHRVCVYVSDWVVGRSVSYSLSCRRIYTNNLRNEQTNSQRSKQVSEGASASKQNEPTNHWASQPASKLNQINCKIRKKNLPTSTFTKSKQMIFNALVFRQLKAQLWRHRTCCSCYCHNKCLFLFLLLLLLLLLVFFHYFANTNSAIKNCCIHASKFSDPTHTHTVTHTKADKKGAARRSL